MSIGTVAGQIFGARLGLALFAAIAVPPCHAVSATAQHHSIELNLTPSSGEIEIRDNVQTSALREFRFALAQWMQIETIHLDDVAVTAEFDGERWLVSLPSAGQHRLEFALRGRVPGRSADARQLHASSTSDGAYLPGYAAWVPWTAAAVSSYRLQVELPPKQRAAGSGRLLSERLGAAGNQTIFALDTAAEPPSLFIGPYTVGEKRRGDLRLRTYFYAEHQGLATDYLDAAAGYIERFENRIGTYPYRDFSIVAAPLPVGLGFPAVAYVGRRILPLPFMRGRSLAHEVLHNWWGNAVTVDYADGNWAEGLTTFMADYALQLDRGEQAAREMRVQWLRDYAALPAARDRPVRAFRSKGHQASQVIGYNKVAFVFHMLTREIGQAAFDRGIRIFWQRHRFERVGWIQLQDAFEHATGRDLDWFFRQWLDRSGAPQPRFGAHSIETVAAGYRIRVEVLQPGVAYRFKLPLLLGTDNGIERHELDIRDTRTEVEWTTPAKPHFVHADPSSDLFRLLARDETPPILRDLTLDPQTLVVVDAGNDEFNATARKLAERLLDVRSNFSSVALTPQFDRPLLLLTTTAELPSRLAQLGLNAPKFAADEATAAVWTARLQNANPVLIVSADNADELAALLRPLPHYGGQSYVSFHRGRALTRGLWPLTRGVLYREF